MISDKYSIQNSGQNSGVIVGYNKGIINLSQQTAVKIPSLISNLIKLLGNACIEEEYSDRAPDIQEFRPDDKIEYNCVIVYKEIIKEFAIYYLTCESYLNTYDDSHIRGKFKILKCVHLWYLHAKGQVLSENKESEKNEIDIIRENSDRIIDLVKTQILNVVQESEEMKTTYQEDIELGIACFICYCFMECKILEKPL